MTDDEYMKEFCSKCINRKGFDDICEIRKNIKGEPQCMNFYEEKRRNKMKNKYYNQIMSIEEAETIIDDMYQDKYKIMEQKTDTGVTIDLSKMDEITFTNLEFASVIVLREIQSLRHEMEKQEKENTDLIKAKIEELQDDIKYSANPLSIDNSKFGIKVLQSLLEKE